MNTRRTVTLVVLCVLTAACTMFGDPPPLEFSVRESLVGAGVIMQLENTSSEPLKNLQLLITSPEGEERSYKAEQLDGYGTLEVGWKKLGGWEIRPGSKVSVRCDGYALALDATVPEAGN